jgi:hypothetical protein
MRRTDHGIASTKHTLQLIEGMHPGGTRPHSPLEGPAVSNDGGGGGVGIDLLVVIEHCVTITAP